MHTLYGYPITLGHNKQVPTLRDIAVTLSRVPRWNGMTVVPWNVLQHSLTCTGLATHMKNSKDIQLSALLHDIEESMTGDIANPVKTTEQREKERDLRKWLYRTSLKLPYPDDSTLDAVKEIDRLVGLGELNTLCHPRVRLHFEERIDNASSDMLKIADVIWDLLRTTEREQVNMFVTAAEDLMSDPAIKSAARLRV